MFHSNLSSEFISITVQVWLFASLTSIYGSESQTALFSSLKGFAELHIRPQRRPPPRLLHRQRDPQELPRQSRLASLGGRAHGLRFPQRLPPNDADGDRRQQVGKSQNLFIHSYTLTFISA